ncbi:MAG TPA: FAD-dependent oxidoreductase [Clostridia bacterium]|nr:FAD-dependent oxidoreductase [Clostridia bacterium]
MKKEHVFRLVLALGIFFLVYQFGIKPIFFNDNQTTKTNAQYWAGQLPKDSGTDYDVIVYGAEPQGISAALSSARLGARTLLISKDSDLGGIITDCMIPELELPAGQNGILLNSGILSELNKLLGRSFTGEKYLEVVKKLVSDEKNLKVLYNSAITGVTKSGVYLETLDLHTDKEDMKLSARMFIDASDDGALLDSCKVPYITGSEDLGLEKSFMPVGLNFEMTADSGVAIKQDELGKLVKSGEFYSRLNKYEVLYMHSRVDRLGVYFPDTGKVVISGLTVSDIDVTDTKDMEQAYKKEAEEARNLAAYLSENFSEFKGLSFSRAADSLRIVESRHYRGVSTLTVNNILDNKYPAETVAMGSYPVMIGKFASKGQFVAGKGIQYGISLGSLVPEKTSNLLMAGPRVSYTSLAASSAGTVGTSTAAGEAAGVAAVFCVARNENPANLNRENERFDEFKSMLGGTGMYLPNEAIKREFEDNWAYPAARQLLTLGLIGGGVKNDLKYDDPARQKDLAYILINGVYRLDRNAYTLDLDSRLRPYLSDSKLNYENTIKILGALYDFKGDTQTIYSKLCDQNRINQVMQLRLDESRGLTLSDVYYLGAYSIKSFTGKEIPE